MKNKIAYIFLIFAAFYFIGCSTTPQSKIIDIPYTFAENEHNKGTAKIIFSGNVRLVSYEEEELPITKVGTRWYPLQFPAGKKFNLRVYVAYHGDYPGYRRRGIFKCPPLEADKSYKIWFESAKRNYYSGAGRLILTYDNVKELKYILGSPRYKQIYVQEISPLILVNQPSLTVND
jgi:hypothetical protein